MHTEILIEYPMVLKEIECELWIVFSCLKVRSIDGFL